MRFYYPSIFSLIFIALFYAVVLGTFWFIWVRIYKRKFSGPVALSVVALVLVLPWLEEFWIAWNFGQLCRKDAGIAINRTVEVEGFYGDSVAGSLRLVKSGEYRFIESRSNKWVHRLEFGDANFLQQSIERYQWENSRKDVAKQDYFRVTLGIDIEALVYPGKGDSWRITKLDRPTARYHYKRLNSHTPVAHQITRFEDVVEDVQTGEILGRYVNYYRGAY
ncbi:MAG: hypothetical protein KIT13_08440 [Burkholderiales bacterium]|nr:hypothetical protein [Burkholderiales bacterium]MCW5604128.1 hypothetical protein [Burkholderiales bacterium]